MPKFAKLLSVRGKEKWLELYRRLTGKEWDEADGEGGHPDSQDKENEQPKAVS